MYLATTQPDSITGYFRQSEVNGIMMYYHLAGSGEEGRGHLGRIADCVTCRELD